MKIPEANEFSPGQVGVRELLRDVQANDGNRDEIVEAIRVRFFASAAERQSDPTKRRAVQQTRAYNALLGASKYGLVEANLRSLTNLGRVAIATDTDAELYRLLARHILRDLHGLDVLIALREMQRGGLPISKTTLQDYLEQQAGFVKMPRATNHHTRLLQWLREAGILPTRGYAVNASLVEEIADVSLDVADDWSVLTAEQKAFLRVLRKIADVEGLNAIPAKTVIDSVITEYGPIFKRPDQLSATIFRPLSDPAAGWIAHSVGGRGRGGKSGEVTATTKLLEVEVDLLPQGESPGIPPDLKAKLQTPLDEVYTDLTSDDTHTKGIALELLAIRLAIDLTLSPIRLRERGTTTGGAEVDLVAEGAHLHFSRWLLQCKNWPAPRQS